MAKRILPPRQRFVWYTPDQFSSIVDLLNMLLFNSALARYEEAEESFSKGLSVAQEDDRAELENALRGAQQLVRLQSDGMRDH